MCRIENRIFQQSMLSNHDHYEEQPIEKVDFNQQYNELLAGVNRIRYLKKRQQKNQMVMNQHFTTLLNRLQLQKVHAEEKSKPKMQLPKTQSQQPSRFQRFRYIFSEESPYKPKVQQSRSGILNFLDKEGGESSKLFQNKATDVSLANASHLVVEARSESRRQKMRVILHEKQQNYQYMREMRVRIEEQSQQKKVEQLTLAKQSRQRVEFSRQQGRKKLEEHYYKHIQEIRSDKQAKRRQKAKLQELRYRQILELQKQEAQELQLFQKSILVEQELKSFIQQAQGMVGETKVTEDTTLM